MKHFRLSFAVTLACLALAAAWGWQRGGLAGALGGAGIAAVLAIMEVSLSFDNAVVNASVLKTWDAFWKRLFLGLGILIAVFGMRLLFPLVIVAVAAGLGLGDVWRLALDDPQAYSAHLVAHHAQVAAFGGVFLLLVFLHFVLDPDKERHWLGAAEARLGRLVPAALRARPGRFPVVGASVALAALGVAVSLLPALQRGPVALAGLAGLCVYIGVDILSALLENDGADPASGQAVRRGGIGAFLYLEVMDASFSFDGVIGAFAITSDIVLIMLGLAIGAMFVRSLTVFLVEQGTLDEFVYLEHGAHYAIGVLALIMLASVRIHVPELVSGLAGVALIGAAMWSSLRHRENERLAALAAPPGAPLATPPEGAD